VAINNIADGSERKCNRMTQQLNIRIKTEEENLPLDLIVVDTRMQSMANCHHRLAAPHGEIPGIKGSSNTIHASEPPPADDNAGADRWQPRSRKVKQDDRQARGTTQVKQAHMFKGPNDPEDCGKQGCKVIICLKRQVHRQQHNNHNIFLRQYNLQRHVFINHISTASCHEVAVAQ